MKGRIKRERRNYPIKFLLVFSQNVFPSPLASNLCHLELPVAPPLIPRPRLQHPCPFLLTNIHTALYLFLHLLLTCNYIFPMGGNVNHVHLLTYKCEINP